MDETTTPAGGWHVFGTSVRGAAHVRDNRANQDAFRWWPEDGAGCPIVVAVADGHGSAEYLRSKHGAAIAVEAAVEELQALVTAATAEGTLSSVKRAVTERLPQILVRRWEAGVQAHLAQFPLTDEERDWLERRVGAKRRQRIESAPTRAYGSTMLAVLMTDAFVVYVQLGDGDILIVADDGTVSQPFPRDPRFLGNEVTSLAMDDSWREVNVGFQALAGAPPALVLLSSDGYSNSFKASADFRQVGSDVLDLLRHHGLDAVTADVEDWLADAAEIGGDDVTLAVLCRLEALAMPPASMNVTVADDPADVPAADEPAAADPGEAMPVAMEGDAPPAGDDPRNEPSAEMADGDTLTVANDEKPSEEEDQRFAGLPSVETEPAPDDLDENAGAPATPSPETVEETAFVPDPDPEDDRW